MAVKIVNRSYRNIFNENDFNWLLGNSGDWHELTVDVEASISFVANSQNPLTIDYTENAFVLATGGSWGELGFDDGMEITFSYDLVLTDTTGEGNDISQTVIRNYTISRILNDVMVVDETIQANEKENLPVNTGTENIVNVSIFGEQDIEGVSMTYGHLPNSEVDSLSLNSVIDGTKSSFIIPDISNSNLGDYESMTPIGQQSGMSIRSAEVRKVQSFADGDGISANYSITTFRLTFNPRAFSGSNNDRDIYTLPLSLQDSDSNQFSGIFPRRLGINSLGRTTDAVQSDMFLFDADEDAQRDVLIDFQFRIIDGEFEAIDSVYTFSLVLFRYANETTYAEKIYLQTFFNVDELLGKLLTVNKLVTLNKSEEDSYILGLEFYGIGDGRSQAVLSFENGGTVKVSKRNERFSKTGIQSFQFKIKYMLSSLYESIQNLENNEKPFYLEGEDSLTDNLDIKFFPLWNNPNISIQNDLSTTKRLGNTGWFNENFNQLENQFNIESVEYFDINGNSVETVDYTQETKVKVTISGFSEINTDSAFSFGFAWVPTDETDFKNKKNPFYRNVFVQSGDLDASFELGVSYPGPYIGAGDNGASMDSESIRFSQVGDNIVFECSLIPSDAFFTLFESKDETDRKFIIWVSVADAETEANLSNRVSLLADYGNMEKNIPDAGEYEYIENAFIEHPGDETSVGEQNLQAIVQDDILARLPFKIPTDGSISFISMKFGVEAHNASQNENYSLQEYQVDLSQFPVDSNGVQQFNFDQSRGFKLNIGNNKNFVKIERNTALDSSDFSSYIAYYGFKIRWEDWLLRNDAPGDFFNATELNQGLNNDWVNYIRTAGWKINFFTEIVAEVDGELLEYKNTWNFTFNDYDENENISTEHNYYRDSDDTLLNVGTDPITGNPLGVILSNEPTRIEISFEILDDGVWDIENTYGVMTLEIDNGPGQFDQRQLSSVYEPESDNPLKPLNGQTKLQLGLDGTTKIITISALVDPDLLNDASRYRITGRIGCGDSGEVFSTGLYEYRYSDKYE